MHLLPEVPFHLVRPVLHHPILRTALIVGARLEVILLERLHQFLLRLPVHLHLAVNGEVSEDSGGRHPLHRQILRKGAAETSWGMSLRLFLVCLH